MENKNYYEWLEISKNASPEVIEKAYKALVKKYHPDLQEGESKKEAEESHSGNEIGIPEHEAMSMVRK